MKMSNIGNTLKKTHFVNFYLEKLSLFKNFHLLFEELLLKLLVLLTCLTFKSIPPIFFKLLLFFADCLAFWHVEMF